MKNFNYFLESGFKAQNRQLLEEFYIYYDENKLKIILSINKYFTKIRKLEINALKVTPLTYHLINYCLKPFLVPFFFKDGHSLAQKQNFQNTFEILLSFLFSFSKNFGIAIILKVPQEQLF